MKALLIFFFVSSNICLQAQSDWTNLPVEDQAEAAMEAEQFVRAVELYEQALALRQAKYPEMYHCSFDAFEELVKAQDNLIDALEEAGQYQEQIKRSQALSIWALEGMKLFRDKPGPYLEYGFAQIKVAEAHQSLKEYQKGLDVCTALIDYFQTAEYNRPMEYVERQIVPMAHTRAGIILKEKGDMKASGAQHEKSVAAWQRTLRKLDDPLYHEEIALQSKNCVQRYEATKDTFKVLKYAALAARHYDILLENDSSNTDFLSGLELNGNTLAIYSAATGQYHTAIKYFTNSIQLNKWQYKKSNDVKHLTQVAALHTKLSQCYTSLQETSKVVEHLQQRTIYLKKLAEQDKTLDYTWSISKNQYDIAELLDKLGHHEEALEAIEEAILYGIDAVEADKENTRKKEWQWIQEFFRYQQSIKLKDYNTANKALTRLDKIFKQLEDLEEGIQYSEYINEIKVAHLELKYSDVVEMRQSIDKLSDDDPKKYETSLILLKLLKKKMRKDKGIRLSFVKHTSALAWIGLLQGQYKSNKKAIKRAMKYKPIDPYLISNYAPTLLFLGKYKKADKFYLNNYEKPFKPGEKLINAFLNDFEDFEKKNIIPGVHLSKAIEIRDKLNAFLQKE